MSAPRETVILGDDWPDSTVLPEQIHVMAPDARPDRGVKALMIAVLEDAMNCIGSMGSSSAMRRQRGAAAIRWARSTAKGHPFAFETICDVLGIDAGAMRRRLFETRADAPASTPRSPSARRVEKHFSRLELPRRRSRSGDDRVA